MIIRVWGIVNDTEVEFTPIPDRPGYWEGYAPRMPGLQDIEVWAESDSGMRGHLECTVMLEYHVHDEAHLIITPFVARLIRAYEADLLQDEYFAKLKCCRKAVG